MISSARTWAVLALGLVLQPTGARAAEDVRAGQGEAIGVVAVEVPVRVLQRGEPLAGLTTEDFEILDRGVPQRITGFEVVDAYAAEPEAPVEGETVAGGQRVTGRSRRGRHIVLLFDLGMGGLPNRGQMVRALGAARTMVREQLGPSDRALVALTSTLLWGFSGDPEVIGLQLDYVEAVLDGKRKAAQEARRQLSESTGTGDPYDADYLFRLAMLGRFAPDLGFSRELEVASQVGGRPDPGGGPSIDPTLEQLTDSLDPVTLEALGSLRQDARAKARMIEVLRGVPEPKYVVMFSGGVDARLMRTRDLWSDTARSLDLAADGFVGAGWVVDVVDTEGIPVTGHVAEADTIAETPLNSSGYDPSKPMGREGFDADALYYLARQTGGELVENTNRPEQATGSLLRRNAVTYLLAFQPTDLHFDGRFHELEVRLKGERRGIDVRHRPGYFEPDRRAIADPAASSLADAELIMAGKNPGELNAGISTVYSPTGRGRVPYVVEIDGRQLVELGTREPELEIQIYAVHRDGSFRDAVFGGFTVDLERLADRLVGSRLRYVGVLELAPGEYEVRALVREKTSGRVSVVGSSLSVPAVGEASTQLYLSVLGQGPDVRVGQPGAEEFEAVFDVFRTALGMLLPAPLPRLADREQLVAVLVRAGRDDRPGAFEAELSAADGTLVSHLELVPEPPGAPASEALSRWAVLLASDELPGGVYTLSVGVDGAGSLSQAFTRVPD